MAPRLSILLATALLLGMVSASGALGAGVGAHRIAAQPNPATRSVAAGGSLIAPPAACPGQEGLGIAPATQEQAMRCMTEFARLRAGLGELGDSEQLDISAAQKSADVLSCDSFSHEACGREFTYWMRQSGYMSTSCWHVAENLAWGSGEQGTVRAIFRAWMSSAEHRHNILGNYDQLGVSLASGELEGNIGTQLWTEHFGSRCE